MEEPSEHAGVTGETLDVLHPGLTEVTGKGTVDWSSFPKGTPASWELGPFVSALLG